MLYVTLVILPMQNASGQECTDLALAVGRSYENYANSSQVESQILANLCASHYESATSDQRAQIEASYELFSGGASGSSQQIQSMQDSKCENRLDGSWQQSVSSSELNRVSQAGAEVVKACLTSAAFRIVSISDSGDGIEAEFRYNGTNDTVINGVIVNPSGIASCKALYNGITDGNLTNISGKKLKSGDTFTLSCTRISRQLTGGQKHYEGGLVGVATASSSPTFPLIEYDRPLVETKTADALEREIQALAAQKVLIQSGDFDLGSLPHASSGFCPSPGDNRIDRHTDATISFLRPYKSPPDVNLSLVSIDMEGPQNGRVKVWVDTVTNTNMTIHLGTWCDSNLDSAKAHWTAIGIMK